MYKALKRDSIYTSLMATMVNSVNPFKSEFLSSVFQKFNLSPDTWWHYYFIRQVPANGSQIFCFKALENTLSITLKFNPSAQMLWLCYLHACVLCCFCRVSHFALVWTVDCQTSFSVHETLQARILECSAMPSSVGSSQPRDWTCVSYTSCIGRWILYL